MTTLEVGTQNWTVVIVGILVVFAALWVLSLLFRLVPVLMNLSLKRKGAVPAETRPADISIEGDTNAAIAMALHLFLDENHDEESNVVTIMHRIRRYSPWSMKPYSMPDVPQPRAARRNK